MNYENAIKKLTSQGKFYINLGLERISEALSIIGNPQDDSKCIHVAGTNGKGSVCAIIASVLQECGHKVGLYTSPHIFDYTERIQINGVQIPKEVFAEKISRLCELPVHLTEFEILTAAAFEYFKENNVDFVVLETGLGGRLDATNVIKTPVCSVITHIDFDHTERLGDTIEKIATEKAGIIKRICGRAPCEQSEPSPSLARKPRFSSEPHNPRQQHHPTIINHNNLGLEVIKTICSPIIVKPCHSEFLALKGVCQDENLALALEAIRIAAPDAASGAIQEGLKKVKHPCRFEYIEEKNLIIDGAHNPNGIQALRESLDLYFPHDKRRFVFGCLKNKNYSQMMNILFRPEDEIYFYEFKSPNAASFEELQAACPYPARRFEEFSRSDYLTVVCGSFYMLNSLCI